MADEKPAVVCAVCGKPGAHSWVLEVGEQRLPVHRGCGDTAKALAPKGQRPRIRPSEWKLRLDRESAAKNFWQQKFKDAEWVAAQKVA